MVAYVSSLGLKYGLQVGYQIVWGNFQVVRTIKYRFELYFHSLVMGSPCVSLFVCLPSM